MYPGPFGLTPGQCRDARELLGWTEHDLAARARRRVQTVEYFETGRGRPWRSTVTAIRLALEGAGVEFVAEIDGEAGVRLQRG